MKHFIPACLSLLLVLGTMASSENAASGKSGGLLLVANQGDRDLSIIDPVAGQQIATVPEGGVTGHEVVASADGRTAYVPMYGNSGVGKPGTDGRNMVVIDIASRKVTGNVDFGHGVRPHCPKLNPKDGLLYVTTELDQSVTIVDPKTLKIVGSVPTGQPESHMLAISSDGRRGYTSNVGPGTVSVLDLENRKTLAVISIADKAQRISVTPDNSMVFTADQTKPQLAVIDTSTNKVKDWIPLPGLGYGTTPTHDGRWLLVAVPNPAKLAVVDLHSLKVVRTIDLPKAPQEVLVQPGDEVAYVSCNASAKVAIINLRDWTVSKIVDAGKLADGLAWARTE
jgi:DNA-binding beta-propeller fold protein YncE